MPLTLANDGEEQVIRHVGGTQEVRRHLEDLGFTAGGTVTIVSRIGGNLIVRVKESRIAIDRKMAEKIIV